MQRRATYNTAERRGTTRDYDYSPEPHEPLETREVSRAILVGQLHVRLERPLEDHKGATLLLGVGVRVEVGVRIGLGLGCYG